MSNEVISILVLVAIFLVATVLPVHMGVLGLVAAFVVIGIVGLVVGAVGFDLDIGFLAVTVGAILSLAAPEKTKGAVADIAWPTVLLICGIVTYVSLLEEIGTVDYLGDAVADIGAPLLSAG